MQGLKIVECGDQIVPIPIQRNKCIESVQLRKEIPVNSARICSTPTCLVSSCRNAQSSQRRSAEICQVHKEKDRKWHQVETWCHHIYPIDYETTWKEKHFSLFSSLSNEQLFLGSSGTIVYETFNNNVYIFFNIWNQNWNWTALLGLLWHHSVWNLQQQCLHLF